MNNLEELENSIDYKFKNTKLIEEAMTHKSHKKRYNYERLEFLGDAVLGIVIGEFLYKKFSHFKEGDLSRTRAFLVNEAGLHKLAKRLDLGKYMFISKAEEINGGRMKASLLSNLFEAMIGAIYLDSDFATVKKIVLKLIEEEYTKDELLNVYKDFKTLLQESVQNLYQTTPEYMLVDSFGPDHKKFFVIEVKIKDRVYAQATNSSKKRAEQDAAEAALKELEAEHNMPLKQQKD